MVTQQTKMTEIQMGEVKMEVLYFVSPNGSVDANEILQQYVTDQDKRGKLKTAMGQAVDAYQIKRDLIKSIRANRNLKDVVKFYSQHSEQPLRDFVFMKRKIIPKSKKELRSLLSR